MSSFFKKEFCATFLRLQFVVSSILAKENWQKAAHKKWVKLMPEVNFTHILRAAYAAIFFSQKITKPNCKWRKAAQKTFVQKDACKMLVKFTTGRRRLLRFSPATQVPESTPSPSRTRWRVS